jgi:hypothetical protein
VEAVRSVCPNLRYQPAFIDHAFYVEYDYDGTIHVPREDRFLEPHSPEDLTETPDEWLDRLAAKYPSPVPTKQWFEIIAADGSQTCASFPIVREIPSAEFGENSSIEFRPGAVQTYGWAALGASCVSSTVMQALDEFLPRPYTYALPITLDGYPCINEAW